MNPINGPVWNGLGLLTFLLSNVALLELEFPINTQSIDRLYMHKKLGWE
jgi:hypothetical protein